MRSRDEVVRALALLSGGQTPTEAARAIGIPRSTVRDWSYGRVPAERSMCLPCLHDFSALDGPAYAYLLGLYLGDGCISAHPRGVYRLRITLDAVYPMIVAECADSVGIVGRTSE